MIIPKLCSIEGCNKTAQPGRKGWCLMHYTRWRSNGDPLVTKYDRNVKGVTKLPEYKNWLGMKERCLKGTHHSYPRYGGRGVQIAAEWVNSFNTFFKDMGPRPTPLHEIDRIDNNGNYEPLNCKWSTKKEQANNRRSNRIFTIGGETMTLKQWCEKYDLNYKSVHARIQRGVDIIDALY